MTIDKFLLKITDKWPAKVLSLAAALIISIFYRLNTLETNIITVPLKTEIAADFIPVNSLSHTIRVTLRGEANNLLSISENDIEAYIDLNKYDKEGTYRVPVQIRKIGNALGVEPLEISVSPVEIQVTLEEKISRFVHVFPVFSGNVAQGFAMTEQLIVPESVIASGPRSSLDNLVEFKTEIIDLEGRNRDFTILVPIINDNPDITIHGSKLIEYTGQISRIPRVPSFIYIPPVIVEEEREGETEE